MSKLDLVALKNAALEELAGRRKVGGVLSTTPVYSRVRSMLNLRGSTSIFKSSIAPDQADDLQAFNYKKGAEAAAAGFGTTTKASLRHTNVTAAGECPNGGEAFVIGFEVEVLGLKKPNTITSADTALNDSDNTSVPVADHVTSGTALKFALEQFRDRYVPYVERSGGKREYLGPLDYTIEAAGGSYKAIYLFAEGWHWAPDTTLIFGFERKGDSKMPATAAMATLAAALNEAVDYTLSDAADFPILLDQVVKTIGARIEPVPT